MKLEGCRGAILEHRLKHTADTMKPTFNLLGISLHSGIQGLAFFTSDAPGGAGVRIA
jgi:hypothetical protein